jgi:hypothetical protein
VAPTFNSISWVLSRHNIKTIGLPPRKFTSFLWIIKDDLGMKTLGIYGIPCECGKFYIGQVGHSSEIRIKEHNQHIRLHHPEQSAVAEHRINLGHHIQFYDTSILAKKQRHMECIIRKTTEIELHPNNMNKEEGFSLNKSWKPLIQTLKKQRALSNEKCLTFS